MGIFSEIKAKIANDRAITQTAYEEALNYDVKDNDECFIYAIRRYFDLCNSNPNKAKGYFNAFCTLMDKVKEKTLTYVFDEYIGRGDLKFKLVLIPKLERIGLLEKLESGGYKKHW